MFFYESLSLSKVQTVKVSYCNSAGLRLSQCLHSNVTQLFMKTFFHKNHLELSHKISSVGRQSIYTVN